MEILRVQFYPASMACAPRAGEADELVIPLFLATTDREWDPLPPLRYAWTSYLRHAPPVPPVAEPPVPSPLRGGGLGGVP